MRPEARLVAAMTTIIASVLLIFRTGGRTRLAAGIR